MDLSTETLDVRYSPIPYARYDIADCWRNFKGKFSLPPLMLHHGDIHQKQQLYPVYTKQSLLVGFFLLYYEGFRTLTFCSIHGHFVFDPCHTQDAFPYAFKTFDKAQLPLAYSVDLYRHMLVYGPH